MVSLIREDENGKKIRFPFEENNVGFLDALTMMAEFIFKRLDQGYLISIAENRSGYFVHFPGARQTYIGLEYDHEPGTWAIDHIMRGED